MSYYTVDEIANIYKDIGNIIRSKRKEKRIRTSQMCKLLDIPDRTYRSYERGDRRISTHTFLRICMILEIDISKEFGHIIVERLNNEETT